MVAVRHTVSGIGSSCRRSSLTEIARCRVSVVFRRAWIVVIRCCRPLLLAASCVS